MMTPFPVPIHRRLHDTMRAVILTNEKPSFPVPDNKEYTQLPPRARGFCLCTSWRGDIRRNPELTQHLADVGFNVNVLKVLEGVGVEQPECGVQSDGNPDTVAIPGQLTHLAILTWVGVK